MPDFDKILQDALDNPILSESADEVGKNLLEAMISELVLIPHPSIANQNVWSTRKQVDQDATITRFKSRVRTEIFRFFQHVMANGNPAATATLDKVIFTDKGIQGTLAIDKNSRERHALADFAGERVVIIMPDDLEQYFESMGEIVSSDDQAQFDLDTGASDEQKSAAASEETPDGASSDDQTAAAEPSDDDRKLSDELSRHVVWVPAEVIATWNSEFIESAEDWVHEMDKNEGTPSLPSFLDQYVGDEDGPVDGAGQDVLIEALAGVNLIVSADMISTWTADDRVEAAEYAALIKSGKLPKKIPDVIGPFLLGGEDSETAPAQ